MLTAQFVSHVPMMLDCPPAMAAAVKYVFEGEYESHHFGSGLDILDIGANIGSFALWADMRWPGSNITCFEPNPGTFAYLERNVARRPNITIRNAAVYPGVGPRASFFSRYAGDGEAGLVAYATDTFRGEVVRDAFDVRVVDPSALKSAHIVKLDVEGAEAAILRHLDLARTELVLAEFQNRRNRDEMREILAQNFVAVLDEECPWDPILDYRDYRQDLKGDAYGRMFYARRSLSRLSYRPQNAA